MKRRVSGTHPPIHLFLTFNISLTFSNFQDSFANPKVDYNLISIYNFVHLKIEANS